jgi:hypothetical protein
MGVLLSPLYSMPYMSRLLDKIRSAVATGRYVVSNHADDLLRERKIMLWQVIDGLDGANLLKERPKARPLPIVEVEQRLADGISVKGVWAWAETKTAAKIVTVHFLDR